MKIKFVKEYIGLPIGYLITVDKKTAYRLVSGGIAVLVETEPVVETEPKSIAPKKTKLDPSARGRKRKIDPESKNLKNKAK